MIGTYKTLVFDCDGVILNSNKLKTQAFYHAALPYGKAKAQDLVEYHVCNGGISRYRKFDYFLQNIVGIAVNSVEMESLLTAYAEIVKQGLLNCTIAPGLYELRQALPHTRWLVVSGSDQAELRDVFKQRNLENLFDGGIFGSPSTKDDILNAELSRNNIQTPAVFIGDGRYDHEAAHRAGLDFIFVSGWSEWYDISKDSVSIILHIESIQDLIQEIE